MTNHELIGGMGHAPGTNAWRTTEQPVSCPKIQTGSCRGCPVLNSVLDSATNAAAWRPRSARREAEQAADAMANTRCPVGQRPDTSLVEITVVDHGLAGKWGYARLKG